MIRFVEELHSCQHFLVDSEFERSRQKLLNYAIKNINVTKVDKKLDRFFSNLKSAAKVNLAIGSSLKKFEEK